jgi:hypothetical protein
VGLVDWVGWADGRQIRLEGLETGTSSEKDGRR